MNSRAQKIFQFVFLFGAATVLLSSCMFTAKKTRKYYAKAKDQVFDIIIVPGVPYVENEKKWSRIMKARVYWSKFLYDKGIAKNVMYSGSAVYTPYYEAMIMAEYAQALGIPKKNIFVETKAEHSTENVYYSYKKSKKLGFEKIALASDPFQSKQLRRFVRNKVSEDVVLIPIIFDTLKKMEPEMTDPAIDFMTAYAKDFISIKKRESLWKRLRGTFGKNLDTTAYE